MSSSTTVAPTHTFLVTNTVVRCALYLNHAGRKEFDAIVIRRRPGLEHQNGLFYICYYADVPNSAEGDADKIHGAARSRNILEADDVRTVQDYVEDMLDLMALDIAPFTRMDVDTVVYPSIIVNPTDLKDKRKLVLRCIEDSLRSERITA